MPRCPVGAMGAKGGRWARTAGAQGDLSPGMSGAGVASLRRHPGVRWGCGRHCGDTGGDVEGPEGPPRGSQGRTSQLRRTPSQAMSPVPCVRDVTSPGHATHAGDTRSGPGLGSQQDGSLTGCARDRQRPRSVPPPSPLCPPRRDTPSRLTFSGHRPGGAAPGPRRPGWVTESSSSFGHGGAGTLFPGRMDGAPVVPGRGMDGRAVWERSARLQPSFSR